MTAVVIAVAFMLAFAISGMADELIIGRWCDRMIPNMPKYNRTMAIVVADDRVLLKSEFGDGSSSVNELREAGGGVYEKTGSATGDKYRIVSNTGELQLLDQDGLIRIAARLENTPQRGECSP